MTEEIDEDDFWRQEEESFDEGDQFDVPKIAISDEFSAPTENETQDVSSRKNILERAIKDLSADARRCGGKVLRDDVNRLYLNRNLSIFECMEIEQQLTDSGVIIFESDLAGDNIQRADSDDSSYRFLTDQEEKAYGRQIQLALNLPSDTASLPASQIERILEDARSARTAFVLSNMRYVDHLARRKGDLQNLSTEDLKHEGVLGLLHAADKFDPSRGFRFKTYATWWIEQAMLRAIANKNRLVRLPIHFQELMAKIRRARSRLFILEGKIPNHERVADFLGIKLEKLLKILWLVEVTECINVDAIVGEDGVSSFEFTDSSDLTFDAVYYRELQLEISEVLSEFSDREQKILKLRFGLETNQDYTLDNIGKMFNLTRERIRQIEEKAMKKLRHPARIDRLRNLWEE